MSSLKPGTAEGGQSQTIRQSVSFPSALHSTLEKIAESKKVSVAWVVRDAVEKYVLDQWPLLNEH